MKNRSWVIVLAGLLLIGGAMRAEAKDTPTRKLGRGVINFTMGIIEIPKNMIEVNNQYGGPAGISWGFFRGVARMATREAVGVKEMITFWNPDGTTIEPEFPFMPEQEVSWRVRNPDERFF